MFGSAPSVVTPEPSLPPDTKPTLDPSGLQDWMKGAVTAGATGNQTKAEKSGFNLGQAAMLGGGQKGSIFGRTQAFR